MPMIVMNPGTKRCHRKKDIENHNTPKSAISKNSLQLVFCHAQSGWLFFFHRLPPKAALQNPRPAAKAPSPQKQNTRAAKSRARVFCLLSMPGSAKRLKITQEPLARLALGYPAQGGGFLYTAQAFSGCSLFSASTGGWPSCFPCLPFHIARC